jgi:cell division initiation protein
MRSPLTPLELRKRTFAVRLRGYDRTEVQQYFEVLADDLEELYRSLDELERTNTRLREELAGHREKEATLRDTLVLAQRSADTLRASAEKEAERIVAEAERNADRLVQQALEQVAEREKRIRELRMERKNFHLKLQGMLDMFQQVLNFDKEEEELDSSVSVLRPKRREGETA